MQTASNETRGMLKRHINRAPWAIEKVQETVLCERRERKIKVLKKEQTEIVLEEDSCKIDLVYNLDSSLTKCRVIYDLTRMINGSTLFFQILSGKMALAVWVNVVSPSEWLNICFFGYKQLKKTLVVLRDFLSFGNPVAALFVEIICYLYVDLEIRGESQG